MTAKWTWQNEWEENRLVKQHYEKLKADEGQERVQKYGHVLSITLLECAKFFQNL